MQNIYFILYSFSKNPTEVAKHILYIILFVQEPHKIAKHILYIILFFQEPYKIAKHILYIILFVQEPYRGCKTYTLINLGHILIIGYREMSEISRNE